MFYIGSWKFKLGTQWTQLSLSNVSSYPSAPNAGVAFKGDLFGGMLEKNHEASGYGWVKKKHKLLDKENMVDL